MDSATITIKITSPSSTDGLTLPDIKANMTVVDLKRLVQDRYPSHPTPNEQRLIFAGHLLNDNDTLQKALSGPACSDKSNATIHLVVRSAPTTVRSGSKPIYTPRSNPTTTPTHTHTTQATTNHPSIVPLSAPFQYVLYNGQPYLMPLNHLNLPQQQAQQPASVLQRFPQLAQAFRQRQLTPAQQRAEVQRRTANLWLALRLFVMVYIFSQGASLERQALFHVLALAIYLWQSGIAAEWARTMGLNLNLPQRAQVQLEVQPEQQNVAEPAAPPAAAAAAAAAAATTPPPVAPANAQGHMRTLSNHPVVRDIEQGFVAFFSSLVPQNPPRIDGADREAENNNNNNNGGAAAAAEAAGGAAGGGLGGPLL